MQGVFVNGYRPGTKARLKRAIRDGERVLLEATSGLGNEYDGPVVDMPEGEPAYVVGPDPYTSRKWYATITRKKERIMVK